VNLEDTPEEAAFRDEFRSWLEASYPGDLALGDFEARRAWQRTMAEAGWAAPGWPRAWGGRDAGVAEIVIYQEELARAGVPPIAGSIGVWNCGPAIMEMATEEQKRRWLPPMLAGDIIWCQGFSEPDAGSDLASLSTRAVRDGDDYVVDGRKIWISYGDRSDLCFLLCRTDPEWPKHKGLSVLAVDMRSPGVGVSPLRDATGEAGFSEVLFEGVRVPAADRVGEENDGWRVAMSTLTHERIGTITYGMQLRQRLESFFARKEAWPDEEIARRLREQDVAQLWTSVELIRLTALRALAKAKRGEQPWPDVPIGKLLWSFASQDLAEAAVRALGLEGLIVPGDEGAADGGRWAREVVWSRMTTIGAGTTEVQKNVLAERALGLPRG
jgi:alkylation response protein AidB-like acyl-CoA dehydrogenase